MDKKELNDLAILAKDDFEKLNDLVIEMGPLYSWAASRFTTERVRKEHYDDAIQVCRIAVMESIPRWEPVRGMQFASYWVWQARYNLQALIRSTALVVFPVGKPVPVFVMEEDAGKEQDVNPNAAEVVAQEECVEVVRAAVDALPKHLNDCMKHYLADFTMEKTGEKLGVTKQAANLRKLKAMKLLEIKLNGFWKGESNWV